MKPGVLVTGGGSLLGQGIIRSFVASRYRESFEIFSSDYFCSSPGLFLCKDSLILPDILKDKRLLGDWLRKLIRFCTKNDIRVIIPGLDFEVPLFAEFREQLRTETGAYICVSKPELINICADKLKTAEWLLCNGFPSLTTRTLSHDTGNLRYPFIVKPRRGSTSKNVHLVSTSDEHKEVLDLYSGRRETFIMQEYLEDRKAEYSCGVLVYDEKPYDTICLRRSLNKGNTHFAEYKENNDLAEFIEAVVNKLPGACGGLNLQLRLRDGIPYIFEINPRFSGTTPLRMLFGMNHIEQFLSLIDSSYSKPVLVEGLCCRIMSEMLIDVDRFSPCITEGIF